MRKVNNPYPCHTPRLVLQSRLDFTASGYTSEPSCPHPADPLAFELGWGSHSQLKFLVHTVTLSVCHSQIPYHFVLMHGAPAAATIVS